MREISVGQILEIKKTMTELENIFLSVGFEITSKRNITTEVLEALDIVNDNKKEKINQLVPKSIRRSFETFAGVQGTPVYQAFIDDRLQYYCYRMKKYQYCSKTSSV